MDNNDFKPVIVHQHGEDEDSPHNDRVSELMAKLMSDTVEQILRNTDDLDACPGCVSGSIIATAVATVAHHYVDVELEAIEEQMIAAVKSGVETMREHRAFVGGTKH